jgi:SAM-dependent methyltransferase
MAKRAPPRARAGGSRSKETVRAGWNRVSFRYRPAGETSDYFGHTGREYRAWLAPILDGLPRHAEVLDLGCGNGIPAARILAGRFRVTGVDLSDTQVRRARRLVPGARFVRADMCEVEFAPGAFAAIVSLYSMIHVPRKEQRPLFGKMATWLAPGGWFLGILGHVRYEGTEARWLGSDASMFWSHYDAATYRRWLLSEGFWIVHEEFVPEGTTGHHLFLARKRRPRSAR